MSTLRPFAVRGTVAGVQRNVSTACHQPATEINPNSSSPVPHGCPLPLPASLKLLYEKLVAGRSYMPCLNAVHGHESTPILITIAVKAKEEADNAR